MSTSTHPPVLDPAQLRRIESTHRGFLYQHLYGVGCLLLAPRHSVTDVKVERDEDIELRTTSADVYVQVKTRESPLRPSDVANVLDRFTQIRAEHIARRPRAAKYFIVSNSRISPSLQDQINSAEWPLDVTVLSPDAAVVPEYLPPAWSSITEALHWCTNVANALPFTRLAGETLAWKLAALIQLASSGTAPYADHTFQVADLTRLFEQVVIQLQRLPAPPETYRAVDGEPELDAREGPRLVVGLSGAGKSSWAAEAATHSEESIGYFDVAEIPNDALAASIAREVAAQLVSDGADRGTVIAPGLSGLDSCRALARTLDRYSRRVLVVVDNAHRANPAKLAEVVKALEPSRVILLAQPGQATSELQAHLGVEAELLPAWPIETIAAEFRAQGSSIDAPIAERIRRLTGALPLFVRQAATLTAITYAGNATKACDELEGRLHATDTPQELILAQSWKLLSTQAGEAGAILSTCDVPLTLSEARRVVADGISVDETAAAAVLRELSRAGIVQQQNDSLTMHDAYRLVAGRATDVLAPAEIARADNALSAIMLETLRTRWDFSRLVFYLRVLARSGKTDVLVDYATSHEEQFAEYGVTGIAEPILAKVVATDTIPARDRFWALDTLTFWAYQKRRKVEADFEERIAKLETLCNECDGGAREKSAVALKKLLLFGQRGEVAKAKEQYAIAEKLHAANPLLLRIFRYDFAVALFRAKRLVEAEGFASDLIADYYRVLGLRPEDVDFKTPRDIAPKLPPDEETIDNLKRLADTLELYAMCRTAQRKRSGLARLHAHKFYMMSQAFTSAIRVGQDAADELLQAGDAVGARQMIEKYVLALVIEFKLLEHLVPVRAQRAVILAYGGQHREALAEIAQLQSFASDDPDKRAELERQRDLIDRITRGEVSLATVRPSIDLLGQGSWPRERPTKVGRNEPCPCGSGMKYKRCCGR